MPEETTKAAIAPKEIRLSDVPISVAEPPVSIYCNHAGINATTWDIRFFFSEVMVIGETPRIDLRATVVMSPEHAKAFARVVTEFFEQREAAAQHKTR